LMINLDIQENGDKIKKMEKAHIFILIVKDIKVFGLRIKKKAMEFIDIRMEMYMKDFGNKIEDMETG